MNRTFVTIFCFCLAAPAVAQPPAGDRGPRPDPVEVYLEQKRQEFEASDRGAASINAGGSVTALYNLLRDKRALQNVDVVGRDTGQKEKVRDALTRTVAYYLASMNMTAAEVTRLQRAGLDPLAAGTAMIAGRARLLDALVVTEAALLARVTANIPVAGNPLLREVRLVPTRAIKGSFATPVTIHVQLSHPPAAAELGETYPLFLSPTRARFNRGAGRKVRQGATYQAIAPLRLEGDRFVPPVSGQPEMQATTAELDSLLERHGRALSQTGGAGR
jgi:hypothetical protein